MEKQKVYRTGQAPLVFTGEQVASGSNQSHSGPRSNRWSDVAIYRTAKGRLVLEVVRKTCWQGEEDSYTGLLFATAPELAAALAEMELGELASDVLDSAEIAQEVE